MNKDSWIALIIASVITIVAATPIFYSRDYASEPRDKMTEGSDAKTETIKEAETGTEFPTEGGSGNEEQNPEAGGVEAGGG